jgi:isoleucyl-tRNA synthetase
MKSGALWASVCCAGILAAVHDSAAANTVHRCEGPDGKVTYSNTQCPAGTSPTRKVDTAPPVSVDEQKAARERAKQDAQAAKQIDKQADKQRAKDEVKSDKNVAELKKTETRTREQCDKALQELDRARDRRADLAARARTIDQEQKAEAEVKRREGDAKRECALVK